MSSTFSNGWMGFIIMWEETVGRYQKLLSTKEIFQRVRHMDERRRPLFPTKLGSKPQIFIDINFLTVAVVKKHPDPSSPIFVGCICKVGFAAEDDEPEVEVYNVDEKTMGSFSDCSDLVLQAKSPVPKLRLGSAAGNHREGYQVPRHYELGFLPCQIARAKDEDGSSSPSKRGAASLRGWFECISLQGRF